MAPSLLKRVQKKLRYANSDMIFEIPIKNGVYGENLSALTHKGAVVAILQPLEKKTRETPKYPYKDPQVGTHTHQKFQTSTITNKKNMHKMASRIGNKRALLLEVFNRF